MSVESLHAANYGQPYLSLHPRERCRDCAERFRVPPLIGYCIKCRLHDQHVRPACRCDRWHAPGTLL